MNLLKKYILLMTVFIFSVFIILRIAIVRERQETIDHMVKTYLSFIEREFPGDTYSIDARFIKYYILPQNKIALIVDLRKWSLDSFVKDGDREWFSTVKKVYTVEEYRKLLEYYRKEQKAAETFDSRQKKWRSSGARPYLNEKNIKK